RPHDTGIVKLANTQNLSQFELHARAILGLPIHTLQLEKSGASAVILAHSSANQFTINGMEAALQVPFTDIRIFGKPSLRPYRRMGVALAFGDLHADIAELRSKALNAASAIQITAMD
ncbi:MAG: hypothetical protein WD135_01190, partial [Ferruginibacter sp.]